MERIDDDTLIGSINGTVINGAQISSDAVFGHSLALDGSSQYINLGNQRHACLGTLHLCSDGITVALWIKPEFNGHENQYILDGGGGTTKSHGISIFVHDPSIIQVTSRKLVNNSVAIRYRVETEIILQEWHHVAVVLPPEGMASLYLDGCLKDKEDASFKPANGSTVRNDIYIGRSNKHNDNRYFKGLVDDIFVFYKVKTVEQLRSLL